MLENEVIITMIDCEQSLFSQSCFCRFARFTRFPRSRDPMMMIILENDVMISFKIDHQ